MGVISLRSVTLKRPYYIDKEKVRFRRPQDWLKSDVKRRYSMWPEDEREILQACDRFIAYMRDHPPRVTGWLSKKKDLKRMLKVKREIEERELARQQKYIRSRAELSKPWSVGDPMR